MDRIRRHDTAREAGSHSGGAAGAAERAEPGARLVGSLPYGVEAAFAAPVVPLPYLAELERAFRTSFRHVRAHVGQAARAAAAALGARAFARGSDVAFADAAPDRALVAHELAHVVQQAGGRPGAVAVPGGPEAEADAAAQAAVAGRPVEVALHPASGLQTWGGADHYMLGNRAGQLAIGAWRGKRGALPEGVGTRRDAQVHQGLTKAIVTADDRETLDVPTRGGSISYGSGTRYGGDYAATPEELVSQDEELDVAGWDEATMVSVAATNANHFFPLNQIEYQTQHRKALEYARLAAPATGLIRSVIVGQALRAEAFAGHFLQDAFASGHFAPRPLDAIGDAGGAVAEAASGLARTKTWHDFFCMLPNGLPTTRGRFHGDNYMDGKDLEHVARISADSLYEVLSTLGGAPESRGVMGRLPRPDLGAIEADPVAGPAWRRMLGAYEADSDDAVRRGEDYETSAGTKVSWIDIVSPIRGDIYGKSQHGVRERVPVSPAACRATVVAQLHAIRHYLRADFVMNRATSRDDEMKVQGAGEAHFSPKDLEVDFGLFSQLQTSALRWRDSVPPGSRAWVAATYVGDQAARWRAHALLAGTGNVLPHALGVGVSTALATIAQVREP